jgi:hypothetical protein
VIVVPIDLGNPQVSPWDPPPRPPPAPETARALVAAALRDARRPGPPVVSYVHGGLPGDALLDALAPHPFWLCTHPAALDRRAASALVARGLVQVELAIWSVDRRVAAPLGRGPALDALPAQLAGLRAMGLRCGLWLMCGLPGSSHASALAEARRLTTEPALRPDFLRISAAPALVGSQLAAAVAVGDWAPMRIGEAVTTLAAWMDAFEGAGIAIHRVGFIPGHDVPAHAVAGPAHSDLRGLCEVRRFRRRVLTALHGASPGSDVVLAVHPADHGWALGPSRSTVRAARAAAGVRSVAISLDPGLPRGSVVRRA